PPASNSSSGRTWRILRFGAFAGGSIVRPTTAPFKARRTRSSSGQGTRWQTFTARESGPSFADVGLLDMLEDVLAGQPGQVALADLAAAARQQRRQPLT